MAVAKLQGGLELLGDFLGVHCADGHRVHFHAHHEFRTQFSGFGQSLRADFVIVAPVFIDVKFAVAIKVLEGVAVGLDDLQAGILGITQGGAALVDDLRPAVGHVLFCPELALGGGEAGHHRQCQQQRQYHGSDLLHVLPPSFLSLCTPVRVMGIWGPWENTLRTVWGRPLFGLAAPGAAFPSFRARLLPVATKN